MTQCQLQGPSALGSIPLRPCIRALPLRCRRTLRMAIVPATWQCLVICILSTLAHKIQLDPAMSPNSLIGAIARFCERLCDGSSTSRLETSLLCVCSMASSYGLASYDLSAIITLGFVALSALMSCCETHKLYSGWSLGSLPCQVSVLWVLLMPETTGCKYSQLPCAPTASSYP